MTKLLARLCKLALVATLTTQPLGAVAQNMFAPVAKVNERAITAYERDQRVRMLTLFRSPGDPLKESINALIDDRIQLAEAKRLGITVTAQEVLDGMEEFAQRASLTRDEFIQALAQAGVERESFRDFVAAGVAWRKVIRETYGGRIALSDLEVKRLKKEEARRPGVRVLLSEIILPANTPAAAAQAERRAADIASITSLPAFANAARQYSASPSRGASGRLEWMPIGNLPPAIGGRILTLAVGEVTPPISVPNAIALFQLRAIEETAPTMDGQELEYAAFYIAGGRRQAGLAEAARVNAQVDTCDDLYGVAKGLPASQLERSNLPLSQIPSDVALELAKLDENEVSTALTRANGQTLVYLMLCERRYQADEAPQPDAIEANAADGDQPEAPTPDVIAANERSQMINSRVGRLAAQRLAELRANATITYLE